MTTSAPAMIADVAASRSREPLVRVVVLSAQGSTPREAGAAMLVGNEGIVGTIGGGQLEHEAIAHARSMLRSRGDGTGWLREARSFALGPALGQCCGGQTRLLFELFLPHETGDIARGFAAAGNGALALRPLAAGVPIALVSSRKADVAGCPLPVLRVARDMLSGARPRTADLVSPGGGMPAWFIEPVTEARAPLYIYGAGHVGRAIVHVLQGLPFDIRWVDTARDRYPGVVPEGVSVVVAPDPVAVAVPAPAGALHLVLTYSHALDLAIVHALLQRADFSYVGLIGSETKAQRFRKRLREAGIADAALARLTCPIGIGGLTGKEPPVIAVSVAAQLIGVVQSRTALEDISAEANGA